VTERADLLFSLGLPPEASLSEIEYFYLERRAEAENRLQRGDTRARAEIDRLERVFERLEGMDAEAVETRAEPVAASEARTPFYLRTTGSDWEANGSLVCGVAVCLVVLWAFYVYWPSLTGSSLNILNLLQSPVYLLIYLLALAAEMLSHTSLEAKSRALFLIKQGLERPDWPSESQISRARAGRYLGWIAAALAILLAIFLVSSFFHFLKLESE
jgi:hypothetical protein